MRHMKTRITEWKLSHFPPCPRRSQPSSWHLVSRPLLVLHDGDHPFQMSSALDTGLKCPQRGHAGPKRSELSCESVSESCFVWPVRSTAPCINGILFGPGTEATCPPLPRQPLDKVSSAGLTALGDFVVPGMDGSSETPHNMKRPTKQHHTAVLSLHPTVGFPR